MKIHPGAEKLRPTSGKTRKPFYHVYIIGHEMVSLKLSKDVSKRSKAENKGKKEKEHQRIMQLNDKYVFLVFLFTGDRTKTEEGGSWEIKVWEAGEHGMRSGRF